MTTIKTLMFAAVTALSLGASAAMAQEGGSGLSVPAAGFYHAPLPTTPSPGVNTAQSGSSDVDAPNPLDVTTHPQFDFSSAGGG
jgi:hypothetical protein